MISIGRKWFAAAGLLALAASAGGCGGGGSTATTSVQTTQTQPSPADAAIARSFDAYLAALNKGDGSTVCESLGPNAFKTLHPPVQRESCAEAITDSIGHPGPGGLVWTSARTRGARRVERGDKTAKLFVTVVSTYKGGPKKAENETVVMQFIYNGWRLAAPDPTLLHAIGQN